MENALWKDVKKISLPKCKRNGHGLANFLAIPKSAGKVKKKADTSLPAPRPRIRKSTIRLVPNSLIIDYVPDASRSVPVSPRTVIPSYENFHVEQISAAITAGESEEFEEADPASEYWQRYRSPGFSTMEGSAQKPGGYFDLGSESSKSPVQISNDAQTNIDSLPPPIPPKNPRRAMNRKIPKLGAQIHQLDTSKLMIPTASRPGARHILHHSVSMGSFSESVDFWNPKYCPSQPLFSPPSTVALRPSLRSNDSVGTIGLIIDKYRFNDTATPAPVSPESSSSSAKSEPDQDLSLETIEQEWKSAMQSARLRQHGSNQNEKVTTAPSETPSGGEIRRNTEPKDHTHKLGQPVATVEHDVVHEPETVRSPRSFDAESEAIERRHVGTSIRSPELPVRSYIPSSSDSNDYNSIEMALIAANKAMEFLLAAPTEPELEIHPLYRSISGKHDDSRKRDGPHNPRQNILRSPPQSSGQRQADIKLQHPLERPSHSPPQSLFSGSLRTRRLSPLDKGKGKAADMSEVDTSDTKTYSSRPRLSRSPDSDALTTVTSWPVPDLVGNVCDRRQYYRRPGIERSRSISDMSTTTDNLFNMLNGVEKRGESSRAANAQIQPRTSRESPRQPQLEQSSATSARRPTHPRTSRESPRQPQVERASTASARRHAHSSTVARTTAYQGLAADRFAGTRTKRPQLMRDGINGEQGYAETQSRFSVWGDDEQSSKSSERKRKSRWKFAMAVRAMP